MGFEKRSRCFKSLPFFLFSVLSARAAHFRHKFPLIRIPRAACFLLRSSPSSSRAPRHGWHQAGTAALLQVRDGGEGEGRARMSRKRADAGSARSSLTHFIAARAAAAKRFTRLGKERAIRRHGRPRQVPASPPPGPRRVVPRARRRR